MGLARRHIGQTRLEHTGIYNHTQVLSNKNKKLDRARCCVVGAGKPGGWEVDAGPAAQHVPDGIGDFMPRGVLVAHMAEHQHGVNGLSVSRSRCHWFASASSDGTVKLWGCGKEGAHIDKVLPSRPLHHQPVCCWARRPLLKPEGETQDAHCFGFQ